VLDARKQFGADVKTEIAVEFTDAGRAGNVNFGDIVADNVDADKQQPAGTQVVADLVAKPLIALA
jgi:hypothetical protein